MMTEQYIADCTCGYKVSDEHILIDSLYPTNRARTEWIFVCQLHNGGCGREVYGSSDDEVIERWNNEETDTVDGITICGE